MEREACIVAPPSGEPPFQPKSLHTKLGPTADGRSQIRVQRKDTTRRLKLKSHLLFVLELIRFKLTPLCTVQFFPRLHFFIVVIIVMSCHHTHTLARSHTYTQSGRSHRLRLFQVILKGEPPWHLPPRSHLAQSHRPAASATL